MNEANRARAVFAQENAAGYAQRAMYPTYAFPERDRVRNQEAAARHSALARKAMGVE